MPRRPEIGNVQLYPDRPLTKRDRNGYQLKFYCPIICKRVRKNCGTRDKREARNILRECRERLLNGEYLKSDGAIAAKFNIDTPVLRATAPVLEIASDGLSWDEALERYRSYKSKRTQKDSFVHAESRIRIAERIFSGYREDKGFPPAFSVRDVMTLTMLEYLQERLLEGDEGLYDSRSPNTVNSMMGAVMAFVRFSHKHEWIERVPDIERLEVNDVMKGRPVTKEEFERMLEATPNVVGNASSASWQMSLKVLWHSGFRVADLMDFCWDDDRHIRPHWPKMSGVHPMITIPSSQKNGRIQEVPMLPGLEELLSAVPASQRHGWILNPLPIEVFIKPGIDWFQPADEDLRSLVKRFSNLAIAAACGESEATVRKWLSRASIRRKQEFKYETDSISIQEIETLRARAKRNAGALHNAGKERLTRERVSRIISMIGKEAGIVVRQADERTGCREKFASAHDIRRGCAQMLINSGVSAETLKVVMRHKDFATTEKHYGAIRSTQSAGDEVRQKLATEARSSALVGGLMGGQQKTPQLTAEELMKLKSLLDKL